MSTTIRSTFAELAGPGVHAGMADEVRVYAPVEAPGALALIIDLQQTPGGALSRLGIAALTRDEATSLVRAIIREGVIGDTDRISIAHSLLMGLTDELAEVTEVERRRLGTLLEDIAERRI